MDRSTSGRNDVKPDRADDVTTETVATLARVAGLPLDGQRAGELAPLLADALDAAERLRPAAARVALADALPFDPTWGEEGSRS
jgi:hypothetical protein